MTAAISAQSQIQAPAFDQAAPAALVEDHHLATVNKYVVDNGPQARLRVACEYANENREVVVKVIQKSAKEAAFYGAAGVVLGALVGGSLGATAVGAVRGGILGATTAAAWSARTQIIKIRKSEEYSQWKKLKITKEVFPIYRQFISQNDLPLCPISLDLIAIPYKCKHGVVFEKEALAKLFRTRMQEAEEDNALLAKQGKPPKHDPKKVLCPNPEGRDPAFARPEDFDSWEDCHYDPQYHFKLFQKLKDKSIENPEVRKAVEAFKRGALQVNQNILSEQANHHIVAVASGADPNSASEAIKEMLQNLSNLRRAAGLSS